MAKKKDRKQDRKRMQREMEAAVVQAMLNGGNGLGAMAGGKRGVFARLADARPGQQLLLGALLGAAAIYVLGDEKLRGKIMKSGMNLYASVLGNLEEMKEQAADLRAELEAEQGGAA